VVDFHITNILFGHYLMQDPVAADALERYARAAMKPVVEV
jgi:hypothetical protein